jgi:hypothetical protein
MSTYQEILSIHLLHEYYENGQCKNMKILPDANTQKWMTSTGVLFRQTENVGRLYIPDSFSLADAIDEAPEDFQLRFDCISTDSLFLNFTEMPIDAIGTLVFTNEFLESAEEAPIELTGTFHANTNPSQPVATILLDLTELESLQENSPVHYSVQFKSREVAWVYYIVNASDSFKADQFKLDGPESDLFNGPFPATLQNGTNAVSFDSGDNLIPFQERSSIVLNLSDPLTNQILISRLPTARPESLQSKTVEGKRKIYSAIYIYL